MNKLDIYQNKVAGTFAVVGVFMLPVVSHLYLKFEEVAVSKAVASYYGTLEKVGLQPKPSDRTYDRMIDAAADKVGIPRRLLHGVALQESQKNPEATSKVGARGLLQVMPFNAKRCGLEPQDLYNAQLNIACGALILAQNLKGNTVSDALCIYNSGKKCSESSPLETKKYLLKVLDQIPLS